MKKINVEEMKRHLKRTLKKKVRITVSLVFVFLMTNSISMSDYISVDDGKIGTSGYIVNEGGVALNPKSGGKVQKEVVGAYSVAVGNSAESKGEYSVAIGHNAKANKHLSTAIGKDTETKIYSSVVVGHESKAEQINRDGLTQAELQNLDKTPDEEGQATAVGIKAIAVAQATALGNDVYARGRSSIAIGSDDVKTYTNKITEYDAEHYFKKLYRAIDPDGDKYGFKEVDGKLKIKEDKKGNIIWSPTLAEGHGAIAIGTRSIAYDNGATAVGTLAYALGKESTAVGTLARAEGKSSIALGNKTAVFANNSVSTGNESQVIADGGMTYGYKAYAGGKNSIAIGSEVYANTEMDYNNQEFFTNGSNINKRLNLINLLTSDLNGVANSVNSSIPLKTGDFFGQNKNKTYLEEVEDIIEQSGGIAKAKTEYKNGVPNVVKNTGNNSIVIGSRSVASGNNAISLGRGTYSTAKNTLSLGSYSFSDADNALSIGTSSKALGKNAIAIGTGTGVGDGSDKTGTKAGYNSLALGTASYVKGNNSSLIGSDARVWGENSLSVGAKNDVAGSNNVALGTGVFIVSKPPKDTHDPSNEATTDHVRRKINEIKRYANNNDKLRNNVGVGNDLLISAGVRNSLILGTNSTIGDYKLEDNDITDSLVIGNGAKVSRATGYSTDNTVDNEAYKHSGNRAMAIGALSEATLENSIALGHLSRTDYSVKDLETEAWAPKGVLSLPSSANVGILSVGRKGYERRISNVAAGYRDTDAVNVSQLKAIEEKLNQSGIFEDNTGYDEGVHYLSINKDGDELKQITRLNDIKKNYDEYVQYRTRSLEIELKKARGEIVNSDYAKKIEDKINELSQNKINGKTNYARKYILKSELYKTKLQTNGSFNYDNELKKIYAAKEADQKKNLFEERDLKLIKESNFNNEGAEGEASIALGIYANSKKWAVAIGGKSKAGETSVSVGKESDARGTKNIAIGNGASIESYKVNTFGETSDGKIEGVDNSDRNRENLGTNSIALGTQSKSIGSSNIAIGDGAIAGESNRIFKKENGEIIKETPKASNAKHLVTVEEKGRNNAIAIGQNAKAKKDNSIAIGQGATASYNDSVAIGNGSQALEDKEVSYLTNQVNTDGRTFSIGSANIKRRLKNLSDGREDSDAVTVAQLKRVNSIKFKGDNNIEQTFELSKKIDIIGSTDTKGDGTPQTWDGNSNSDTMHTVENVKTFVSKSSDTQKILIGIKNKPRFGSVKLGNNGEVVLGVNNGNLQLNNKKITGISNGEADNDVVAYGQVKNLFSVKADNESNPKNLGLGKVLEITGRKEDNNSPEGWTVGKSASEKKSGRYVTDNVETYIKQDREGKTTVLVGIKESPTFKDTTVESLTVGVVSTGQIAPKFTKDSNNNLVLNSKKLTGLSDGTINTTSTDVVSGKQLNDYIKELVSSNGDIVATKNSANNGGQKYDLKLSNTLKSKLDSVLTTDSLEPYAKKDGTNIIDEKHKSTWRTNLELYKKSEVDSAVKKVTEKVESANTQNIIVSSSDGENGLGKTYKVDLSTTLSSKINSIGTGTITENDNNTATGDEIYKAIKNAKTKVDLKDNEKLLEIEKTETNDISSNIYKLGINKNNVKDLARESIDVASDSEIIVTKSTDNSNHKDTYKIKLDKEKVKSIFKEDFANKDASNITDSTHQLKWREKLNVYSKDEVNNKVETAKEEVAAKNDDITVDTVAGINGKGNTYKVGLNENLKNKISSIDDKANKTDMNFKYKSSTDTVNNIEQTLDLTSTSKTLDFQAGDNLTSKVSSGVIKYGLKDTLTGINSISNTSAKSKITLEDNALKLTHDGAGLSLTKTGDKIKLTGLADGTIGENSTEAITGKQLNSFVKEIETEENDADKLLKVTKETSNNGGQKYTLGINDTNLIKKLSENSNISSPIDATPKLVTDKQVYEAIKGAKTTVEVKTGEDIITVEPTATTGDIKANNYKLSVNKDKITNLIDVVAATPQNGKTQILKVTSSTDKNKKKTFTIDLEDTVKNKIENALDKDIASTTYAKVDLSNVNNDGKKLIRDLVNVDAKTFDDNSDENILNVENNNPSNDEAKTYKLSVNKSKVQDIAKDTVVVEGDDNTGIKVSKDTTKSDNKKTTYKVSLDADKIKELAGTTNVDTTFAKVDGTNLDSANKDNWAKHLGTNSIAETIANNDGNGYLVTEKAVKDYVTKETESLNLNVLDNSETSNQVNLKTGKLKFANGGNTTASIEQDNTKKITTVKYDINSDIKGITSISKDSAGNSTKLTLNDNDITINNKKITGLADAVLDENSTEAVSGKVAYNAIKNARTKIEVSSTIQGDTNYLTLDENSKNNDNSISGRTYTIGVNKSKLKEDFAQKDASNITEEAVKEKWRSTLDVYKKSDVDTEVNKSKEEVVNGIGIEVSTTTTTTSGKKFTVSLNQETQNKLNNIENKADKSNMNFKYKSSTDTGNNIEQTLDLTSTSKTLDFQAGDNLTSKVSSGVIKYGLKDTLTGINSISNTSTKSKITLEDNALKLTHDGASVIIAKDGDKAKISGLKDFDVNSLDYGKENSGIAATQKEVKDVLNKINANGTEQDKLKNGTLGTVVYTDKDGNKLMKDTDGKFYKAKENGQKEDNAQEIKKENIILSTVNSDGKTIESITLGNVASALGLSKDKKDNKEVIKKLINKEAKKDLEYTEAELNKVVTLRDLQFLASKGITFAGSTGTANKFLGDTITINGSNSKGLTNDNFANKYETKNIAVKVDNTSGNIEVGLAKELSKINSITSEEDTNDKTKTKITLSKDGATFGVEKDVTNGNNTTTQQVGIKTTIGKDGISVTKQGETNPSVSIKAGDTTNGPSIDFATKEEVQGNDKKTVGTGSITGLKDLDDKSDGHMAANKNYVDKKFDDVANKVVNINKQVNQNINDIKQNSKDIKSLGEQIKTVEKLSKAPIKFGTNSGYVDKKLGDAIKIKGTGTVTKKYDEEYNSNNIATKTDEKGNIVIGISKELKDMKSFETEQDKTTGNSSKLDQNGLTITDKNGTKENPRHTVEITKDKIVFKKEYKDGTKDNVENGIVIDNKSNTITGIKTKDTDKGDTVVSKQYVDDKLNQKPFGYFVKNTVFGSDGKEYSKDTVEVDGKRFEGTDKVIKGEDNNYYKEKDIKGRKYDSKTHLWSGADIQPTPVDEAKPLNSTNLVRGKDGKFYNPIDLEDAIYDKDSNKYKKNGADVTGGKEANDVVIKALPNIKPMALSNIGDGRMIANSTDAVNGGQVFEALKGKLDKDGSNIEQKSFATNASKGADLSKPEDILVTDKQVSEHLKNNYYNKTQVNNMISTIDNKSTVALEKSELALGGVANAVAMANLVQVNSYSDYRHNLSAAYGYYGGSHALAVGFSGTNEERNFVYKLSGSVNNKGNLALGVGAGVMLGDVDEHNINKLNVKKVTKKLEFANEKIEKYEKRQQETDKKIKELSEYKENSEKRIQELEKKLERLIKNK